MADDFGRVADDFDRVADDLAERLYNRNMDCSNINFDQFFDFVPKEDSAKE